MENHKFSVSSTPHIRSKDSIEEIMKQVLIALTPATIAGIYFFGLRALLVVALSISSCIFFEWLFQKTTGKPITITDYSAAVTGLLLAMNLPASSPFWMPIVGSFFAIIIVKQLFGGLGQNFMNPALAARAFLLTAYPTAMTDWTEPVKNFLGMDAVASATPLARLSGGGFVPDQSDYINALIGNVSGCIGETSAILLALGGIYLIYKKIISWRIPGIYIGTVFVLSLVLGRTGFFSASPVYELLIGGLMLGAFFMATDYSSSPLTPVGQIIAAVICGVLTVLIRMYGGYPEGVSYSILIMNLFVPLLDKYTKPKVFGAARKVK